MDSSAQEAKLFRFTEENYTTIFNTHWRKLYAIAYRRLHDAEVAKDMVQEVFVYCWQQREAICITTSAEAYLRTALQYQLVAHFRKLDINDRAFAYLYQRMVEVEEHMRDILTEQDLANTLNSEVEQMPDTMREIFRLRIRDYTVDEIAQSLNIAEKTVRNNISKGLHRLRKAVSKDFPEDFSAVCFVLYLLLT
ncbi:DNA-directed RNA polymerase sigma-70 factor [Parapedobacter defluvii]|uniref:DNA-directed RNA polymerase sigma-70 factor n=1 Tax=Parapedobacter defluvii TaxID=2045106 RepID=A0ABQ1LJL2_9SPHI|nr:sigma-70 family RNA polymerase sigma factor [Parapedobacter defluvii]GGC23619.1 DNA-directed RNA polymerase sigma-70 factor [Parapedobacter defluvii]